MKAPCSDCWRDTSFATGCGHYYTAQQAVWRQATQSKGARFLCLDCLEQRLDRPLTEADFIATPPEILARFGGQAAEPLPATERARELAAWRTFTARRRRR
jgi:hypothetical protein